MPDRCFRSRVSRGVEWARTRALAAAVTAVAFSVWMYFAGWPELGSALVFTGLDPERAQLAVALAATMLGAAAGGILGRAGLAWALSAALFLLLYLVPTALSGRPPPARGETLDIGGFAAAFTAQAALAAYCAGAGAALGRGTRAAALALGAVMRSGDRARIPAGLAAALLVSLSLFGLSQSPNLFMYGPWEGIYRTGLHFDSREETLRYHSAVLGADEQAVVILPPGYASDTGRRYAVLYLLHGSPGSEQDWPRQGVGQLVAAAAHDGYIPPMVIVAPNGDGPHGGSHDSWADDYVPGDRIETSFLTELIPAVEAHFRVESDRSHRVIAGLSSGGYGAVNMALRHPGLFAAALDFSGDVRPPPTAFAGNRSERLANDPMILAARPKPPQASAFFVGWGSSDPAAGADQRLVGQLRASGYSVSTAVVTGGHEWSAWRSLLTASLDQLGDVVGAPSGD